MIDDQYERKTWEQGKILIGVDEAGMGCVAGNLFVAGAAFPIGYDFKKLAAMGLNDSKKLKEEKRFSLLETICADATFWFCDTGSVEEVESNTAWHTRFNKAIPHVEKALATYGGIVYMDGNHPIKINNYKSECLVKGDAKCFSIAAASIIAKTSKDKEMACLDSEFPEYGWKDNKGYGTAKHKIAIQKYGLTKYHRKSYCKSFMGE